MATARYSNNQPLDHQAARRDPRHSRLISVFGTHSPVPHVVESFLLESGERGTRLIWQGELGTDFWSVGAWWGERVARQWDRAVRRSLAAITTEAERRAR